MRVEVLDVGMVTPLGLTARSSAAAVRAGVSRLRESSIQDKNQEALVAGFLEEEALPPLRPPLETALESGTARHRRLLRLAAPALQEACRSREQPVPLLLALPEVYPWGDPLGAGFLAHLAEQSGVALDLKQSQVFRLGRAGGLVAVAHAQRLLAERRATHVLVGGVDTYRDARLLATLDAEARLHTGELPDGFVPGEGAAFLLLGASEAGTDRLARLLAVGSGKEPGHWYSTEPYRGEGLSDACRALFEQVRGAAPRVRCVYAGFNGERFWTKEWGVAFMRHAQFFEAELRVEHPVEFMGDPGAALGPVMLALAAIGLRKGYRQGPCLVWCSSDREERGAVLLDAA
jgi:3-oxoacyl-[acyl-carrier-protein] synthase-1